MQLHVCLSRLNNHKLRDYFKDTIDPMCSINDGIEGTEYFLLSCNLYHVQRYALLGSVNATFLTKDPSNPSNEMLLKILLCGDESYQFILIRKLSSNSRVYSCATMLLIDPSLYF